MTRREMLRQAGLGFGAWALLDLLGRDSFAASPGKAAALNPLAAKPGHFPAKARSAIFLFMQGGPSHIDTFDPKPLLTKLDGNDALDALLQDVVANTAGLKEIKAAGDASPGK